MKNLFLSLPLTCLLAGGAASAAESTMTMPDGSKEMYVGLALASGTAAALGEHRPVVMRVSGQIQWSNGIFLLANGVLGMQLSEQPTVEYGPLLLQSNARQPGDERRLAGTRPIKGTTDAGGFYNYYLGDQFRLRSNLVYNTSARGWTAETGLQKTFPDVAPHHELALSLSLGVADGQVMRELYAVRGDGTAGGRRDYQPSAGVLSVSAGVNWNWALSSHWLVTGAVTLRQLGKGPADSPVIERAGSATMSAGLGYRF